jgi:hypothetical protein
LRNGKKGARVFDDGQLWDGRKFKFLNRFMRERFNEIIICLFNVKNCSRRKKKYFLLLKIFLW